MFPGSHSTDLCHFICNSFIHILILTTGFRFLQMLSALHFNNNNLRHPRGHEGFDPLFKLRPILDRICAAFQVVYHPTQYLTMDEGMAAWRGNLSFKVINAKY